MNKKEVKIIGEYINLGQLLKLTDFIDFGGEAKSFLLENKVLINDLEDNRRGRKLRPGDIVVIDDTTIYLK
ncbi:MAG: S4 domain-containing protein YaaA [Erysipelotrichaceae bacterium]